MTSEPFVRVVVCAALLATAAAGQEKLAFSASDGQPLVGSYWKTKSTPIGGAVLVPMEGSNRYAYDALASRLTSAGVATLALDPRGHGDAAKDREGRAIDVGPAAWKDASNPFRAMHLDAAAALKRLAEAASLPEEKLALIGAGAGAAVALDVAARSEHPHRPRALVLLSPATEAAGLRLADFAPGVKRPTLVFVGKDDDQAAEGATLRAHPALAEADFRTLDCGPLRGTGAFGKVPGLEASIATWTADVVLAPPPVEIGRGKLIVIDGALAPEEQAGATSVEIPFAPGGPSA
ncbi:MAG TPA: alpha/beta fold hydrolase, partial [Planctomycetota bacterium]|nr:alpha/beta fold hydrolase [Planctomycetota bacterium]